MASSGGRSASDWATAPDEDDEDDVVCLASLDFGFPSTPPYMHLNAIKRHIRQMETMFLPLECTGPSRT
jgi:hypothetical protein